MDWPGRPARAATIDCERGYLPKRGYRFIGPVLPLPAEPPSRLDAAEQAATTGEEAGVVAEQGERLTILRRGMDAAAGFAIGAIAVAMLTQSRAAQRGTSFASYFQEAPWDRHAGTGVGTLYPFHLPAPPFAISPDGRHLAIAMAAEDAVTRLWIRSLSQPVPRPLAGTETAIVYPFFWSPDSNAIGFDATGAGSLKTVGLVGGAPQSTCELPAPVVGGSWNQWGVIIVGQPYGAIMKCPAAGGAAKPVTSVETSEPEAQLFPSFLPDGRHFIYLTIRASRRNALASTSPNLRDNSSTAGKRLLTTGFAATYVPAIDSGPGVLVFGRDGALFAQRFDERRLQLAGEPIQLADPVGTFLDGAEFSASATTTLVYRRPAAPVQLKWFDRGGREVAGSAHQNT